MIDNYVALRNAKLLAIYATALPGQFVILRRKFDQSNGLEKPSEVTHFSLDDANSRKRSLLSDLASIDAIIADCAVAPKMGV